MALTTPHGADDKVGLPTSTINLPKRRNLTARPPRRWFGAKPPAEQVSPLLSQRYLSWDLIFFLVFRVPTTHDVLTALFHPKTSEKPSGYLEPRPAWSPTRILLFLIQAGRAGCLLGFFCFLEDGVRLWARMGPHKTEQAPMDRKRDSAERLAQQIS